MRSGERLALLICNSAIAGLCGLAVAGLASLSMVDQSPVRDSRITQALAPSDLHRLAFVPAGMFAAQDPLPEPLELRQSVKPDATHSSAWTSAVEVQPTSAKSDWQTTMSAVTRPSATRPVTSLAKPRVRPRYYTLKARLAEMAPGATVRLAAKFEAAKAAWPPADVVLVAVKDEKTLELHARSGGGTWTLIHRYRVLAASGAAGPKLRRGDRQVPEGVYGISFLNPNSAYHVSLRVNYPNAFDRKMAAKDGRTDLGGDIMIHGKNLSAGCLAIGDEAAEELFVLAAQTGLPNVKLIIAPTDFRQNGPSGPWSGQPEWVPALYAEIATAMAEFKPKRSGTGLLSLFTWGG